MKADNSQGKFRCVSKRGNEVKAGGGCWVQGRFCLLIVHLVKNPPAMQETPVRPLGWEDTLEKGQATHFNVMAWRIPWTVESMGSQKSQTQLSDFHFHFKVGRYLTQWLSDLFLLQLTVKNSFYITINCMHTYY